MTEKRTAPPVAVDLLQELGMSQYEAKSYVALLCLGEGTARTVSETTDVPRTRIYDSIERLQERSLVDVQHASPQVFRPVARETALGHFRDEYDDTIAQLADCLVALEPVDRSPDPSSVWTTTGRAAVDDRVSEFLTGATDEIVYLTIERRLTDESLSELRAASERGVTVRLAPLRTRDASASSVRCLRPSWSTPPGYGTGRRPGACY